MPTLAGQIPAVLLDVEITEPLPTIPGERDGVRVGQAWLLLRRCTEPVDLVRLPLPETGLTPSDLATPLGVTAAPLPTGSSYVAGRVAALALASNVTVVVCTRNRPQSLARTLESVRSQRHPSARVLVVDNAPTEPATLGVAKDAGVDYLAVEQPGLSRARNAAVRATAGETLAWIDDDEVADRYWLGEIARGLVEHPDADVLCGSIVAAELETPAQMWFEQFGGLVKGRGWQPAVFSPATRHTFNPLFPLPPFGAGANMVTRPGVIERMGGFDPALGAGSPAMGGEDTLFFSSLLRAGGTIAYQPRILTRHYHRRDLDGLRAQLVGYGTGLTAAYTALVRREPAVLVALAGLAPRAARELFGPGGRLTATTGPDFPVDLLSANRRAMLRGPAAYRRGRAHPAVRSAEPGPVKVTLVELSGPAPQLAPHRQVGPPYQAVRLFALCHGRPVGEITMPFDGRVLTAEEVGGRLAAFTTPAAREPDPPVLPKVSVIVPTTFARQRLLARCVAALGRLDYPRYEVIVVDNRPQSADVTDVAGSAGGPADWLSAMRDVRVVAEHRPGTSAARNAGLAAAAGEIVAFTDDDTVVDPGWLRALAARFLAEPDVDCVTGLVLPGELETPAQIWFEASGNTFAQKYERATYAGGPFTVTDRHAADPHRRASIYRFGEYGTGSNMAFRAGVLRDLGGFDEALGPGTPAMAGEDVLLFLRLLSGGGRLAYEPGAFVRHWHRRDVADLVRQTRSYGIGLTAMLTAARRPGPAPPLGAGQGRSARDHPVGAG